MSDTTELSTNEWIVIFYPRTGALRLHPTLDAARQHLSKAGFFAHVYKSPKDFQSKHDHLSLEKFWSLVVKNVSWRWPKYAVGPRLEDHELAAPDVDTERLTHELWAMMQRVGDRVVRLSLRQTRSKDHYEIKLDKIRALMADEASFKKAYPKQCRVILNQLSRMSSPYVLESELQSMMNHLVAQRLLKTKQDPWLIMQYYRVQLIKDGLVLRGSDEQEGGEDSEVNDEE